MTTLTVPARFKGPPHSGNGGWTQRRARRGLRARPGHRAADGSRPRSTDPLDVVRGRRGLRRAPRRRRRGRRRAAGRARHVDRRLDGLVRASSVSLEQARAAEPSYPGRTAHPFPTCFACGPGRAPGDGLWIFPGRIGDGLVAASWTPDRRSAGADGEVGLPVTWAALDCVGGWSSDLEHRPMVLAQMAARVGSPPVAGTPYVVRGRLLRTEGRKTWTASALSTADGRLRARPGRAPLDRGRLGRRPAPPTGLAPSPGESESGESAESGESCAESGERQPVRLRASPDSAGIS